MIFTQIGQGIGLPTVDKKVCFRVGSKKLVVDWQGELQYFIGVQLDGSEYLEPERNRLSENKEKEGAKVVQETANNIDGAVRELPDANMVSAMHSCF